MATPRRSGGGGGTAAGEGGAEDDPEPGPAELARAAVQVRLICGRAA
tara:strand:+ start:112 stop:252 length:141 start_codon:yes stop_codon:yes gene_type:complete